MGAHRTRRKWLPPEVDRLTAMIRNGWHRNAIGLALKRSPSSIDTKLKKLGLRYAIKKKSEQAVMRMSYELKQKCIAIAAARKTSLSSTLVFLVQVAIGDVRP